MSSIRQNKEGLKVLFAGVVLQLFLGIIYVWSVFKAPVSAYYGWEPLDVGLTASFMLCFFAAGILAGGKVQSLIGVKYTTLLGGLLVSAGMLASAFIPADGKSPVFLIYLFYGIIGGAGVGAAYNAIISNAQRWFPENRGFATGVSVCSFGFSAVVFAPLIEALNNLMEVNATLLILSGVFAVATLSTFSFIKSPEQVSSIAAPAFKGKQYTLVEMIKTLRFYLIAMSMMFGMSVFFVVNPDLKDLAINRNAASFATVLVMVMGIANSLGRLCVPLISDKIGTESTDILILLATSLSAFCLCFVGGFGLIATISLVAFCYGGFAGLYPVLTSDNFGIKNVGSNYGAVMGGFMVSALLFPFLISKIDAQIVKFVVLGIFAAIGAALIVLLKFINSRKAKD